MKILAVGTQNRVKIAAVTNVVRRLFGDRFKIVQVKASSGVPNQPIGLEQTIQGAINRARQAIAAEKGAEFGIGIEAGLVKTPGALTGYFDIQFAAVADRRSKVTIGCGSGFEYPPAVVHEVLDRGKEIGDVMELLTGIVGIGEKMGAIGYLSHGELDRTGLTEQAVLMAFIPRMNEKLYFEHKEGEA